MVKRGKGDGSYLSQDNYLTIEKAKEKYEKATSFIMKVRALEIWKTIAYLFARKADDKDKAKAAYKASPPDSLAKKLSFTKFLEFAKAERKINNEENN